MSSRQPGIAQMNNSAVLRNTNSNMRLNKNIRDIRRSLKKTVRKPVKKTVRKSVKKSVRTDDNTPMTGFIWAVLTVALIITIVAFIYYIFSNRQTTHIISPTKVISESETETPDSDPKGVLDMPTQEGAPVSTEGPPDDTENTYLNLYGSPDAPGFSRYPGGTAPGYRSYAPWGQGPQESYTRYRLSPLARNAQEYSRVSRSPSYYNYNNYYNDTKLDNIPRYRLNEYVQSQNNYIKNINRRVRQINTDRMYSPRFLRHKAELKELRNFERKLANKVHREKENQPYLPDSPYL